MRGLNKFKLILDVRSKNEIIKNGKLTIPNIKWANVEYDELILDFEKNIKPLVKQKDPVLVYCQSGRRSRHVTWLGKFNGYNFTELDGGCKMYKEILCHLNKTSLK